MTARNGKIRGWASGRVARAMRGARMSALALLLLAPAIAPAFAQTSVANAARVANPAGVTCSDAATNPTCTRIDEVTTPVAPAAVQDYDFCPVGGPKPVYSIVNGVRISEYIPGAASDAFLPQLDFPVPGNLNGLMVDPVRNRLLFLSRSGADSILWAYDADNGGWYQAAPAFASPDFPRAGMTPAGVGYFIAGGSNAPAVWRVEADPAPGSFNYTVQSVGNLQYDVNPTDLGSGDIAFDGEGAGWLSAGQDLYRIDFSLGLEAVRQTRPLLNGAPATINWAGVAFAEDGRLYVADNTAASRYYGYDPATGVLTPAAPTTAAASRDLASCAFPVLAEAEFSVVKTLAQVNGAPAAAGATVASGDVLTYAIAVTNDGGAAGTLFPGDVVETLPANTTVVAAGNDFTCAGDDCPNTAAVNIPAGGTAILEFVVQVVDPLPAAVTSIENAVVVEGVACTDPGNDCTETTPVGPAVTVAKTSDVGDGTPVSPGDTLTFTVQLTVANAATTGAVTLTDTLGDGLSLVAVTAPGAFTCNAANPLVCVLPAGTAPGTYPLVYTASVDADATTSVSNSVVPSGDDAPTCAAGACETTNPLAPAVTVAKAADPATGGTVAPGDTVTYTLTATVANSATTEALTLTDTLGNGLTFGAVTAPGAFTCAAGNPLVCTLPAGTLPGSYAVTYTATVDADATGTVGNSVVASNPPGGDPEPVCTTCTTEHPIVAPAVTVAKAADPATGGTVAPGDTVTYTLTATVANSATTEALTLTDTLGNGLTFGAVTAPGAFTCAAGDPLVCTLPAGTLPGSYAVRYTATVDAEATGTVGNSVVASNPPGGDPEPVCTTCTTEHPITDPSVTVAKSAVAASGTTVIPGETISYTLVATITNSAITETLTLTDTLGNGLTFGAVTAPGAFTCAAGDPLVCTLPAGTLPGSYAVSYTATVDAEATGTVGNSVVAGNPPGGDPEPVCTTCTTEHPVIASAVSVAKTSDPVSGTEVLPGDTIAYTLTATVTNSATTEVLTLADTLGDGLGFGAVTAPGAFTCAAGEPLVCTLPAGTLPGSYALTYTATVDADATGTVGNSVVAGNPPGGDPEPVCTTCTTEHPIVATAIEVVKSADPAAGTEVAPGDTLAYTLAVTVANSATTEAVTLTDTLGNGLTLVAVTAPGAFTCATGNPLVCTLPAGTLPGTYPVSYTATVDADATVSVGNSVVASNPPGGDPEPVCTTCSTEHPVVATEVTYTKSVALPAGNADGLARPGDILTYTLRTTVANSATTAVLVLTDTLGDGLTVGTVAAVPPGTTCNAANPLVCSLPAGLLPGVYDIVYTATVDADATGSVRNAVLGSGDDAPSCAGACSTETPIADPRVTFAKTADPVAGEEVAPGDTIRYTLSVTVAESATTSDVVLTDTLGDGLTAGVLPTGCTATGQVITCVLGTGALPGSHAFEYTATVDAEATVSVANSVTATGGGGEAPECGASCRTEHPVVAPAVTVAKTSDPASGEVVGAGDEIAYTLAVTVANSATTEAVVLVDTLSGAHALLPDSIEVPAGASCAATTGGLECTLAAGALPGTHAFTYRTRVAPDAVGNVGNAVVATGGGGSTPECTTCSTTHRIADPVVTVSKLSDPASGAEVAVGDTLVYTLSVAVARAATLSDVVLVDTPDPGLTIGALPAACSTRGSDVVCVLPAGSVPGTYAFQYPATVNADAGGTVANVVVPAGGGREGAPAPDCTACATSHEVTDTAQLRIVKTAGVRQVRIGDLVRYTLQVENVGTTNVRAAAIVDTAAAGFSYVDGSLAVADLDDHGTAAGHNPIRFEGIDIDAGEHATLTYLMRVGAGVRTGTHVNQAQARSADGDVISNVATAEVQSAGDPLLEESLVFGTVFDDRDRDGWQDDASLSGLHVQGGFAADAYVPGSTTIDRGNGHEPVADAGAPLLQGIAVGSIAARQSEGDPASRHQVVVRQRLRPDASAGAGFTDDFVLRNDQGVTLRMDAAGTVTVDKDGEAAKGLNAAAPHVERRVAQGEGGLVVDYVIRNDGIDDRGIPGVRIASVEGLLVETDQFGRYHLVGIDGGAWERGRNFILKVDPSTLPPGSEFTTDNPLLRRVTPGLPVRFDFGVTLPVETFDGGAREFEIELGEVPFAAGSAVVEDRYLPAIAQIAAKAAEYDGGEVAIRADGEGQALAYERAQAVRAALLAALPADRAQGLTVVARGEPGDPGSLVAGASADGPLLGTVLFDTDRAEVRPEFGPLLDRIAASLEQHDGGVVVLVGHADRRASDAYNVDLGMRRARAVYDALAARLSPETRSRVRVESSNDPAAPAGARRK